MEEALGQLIKRRRGRALTQGQLADLVGISKSMVSQIEQNKKTPSIPVLQKIAQALDADVRDLLGTEHSLPSGDLDAGVVAIRRALTPVNDLLDGADEEVRVSLIDARRTVDRAWGAYSFGRLEVLESDSKLEDLRSVLSCIFEKRAGCGMTAHPHLASLR
ncbi:helix-turn-helix transcriptional regulator [Nocardia tengchongensis]|uniref:helix-turn-helix transcriptional regulator n=1 Tax=Nocardia tengchongensis TaxID=2055889 RepID=UPI0036BA76CA